MSLAAMVYVIYRSKAKGMTKYVQLLIADYTDADTGQAGPPGPSLEVLAGNGGIGKATVARQVEKLTTLGELLVERGGPAEGNANVYTFPRFRDEQKQRTGADRPRNHRGNKPSRPVDNPGRRRTADGPQTDRSVGRYMDDPDPDPLRARGADNQPKPGPPVTHDRNPGHAADRDNCPACGTGGGRQIGEMPS
jgi:hypothetical protein